MQLPGGVLLDGLLAAGIDLRAGDGRVQREVTFARLDGHAELALAEAATQDLALPDGVTRALAAVLGSVGGVALESPAQRLAVAARMSVGDRQFLMRALGTALGMDRVWLTGTCTACAERFDVEIAQSAMPVKVAGDGYPFATLMVDGVHVRARVPNGEDQSALLHMRESSRAAFGAPDGASVQLALRRALLARLVLAPGAEWVATCDGRACDALEAALEEIAPEVGDRAATECPGCGAANEVFVDPYATLWLFGGELFDEIHRLASAYHWSERDILDLPRDRRQRYLRLLAREPAAQGRSARA